MAPAYKAEDLLKVRECIKDTSDVVRKIASEAGIRSMSMPLFPVATFVSAIPSAFIHTSFRATRLTSS